MAGFSYRKNLDGSAYVPSFHYNIGKNDVIFTVGDAVRINSAGFTDLVESTEQIYGFVQTVVDKNGASVAPDTGTTNTWTMNASNQTSTSYMYQVAVIPALPHYLFSCDSDTTLAQADIGEYFGINTTSDGILTSGHSDTPGTLEFQLIGRDPDGNADASMALVRVIACQLGVIAVAANAT